MSEHQSGRERQTSQSFRRRAAATALTLLLSSGPAFVTACHSDEAAQPPATLKEKAAAALSNMLTSVLSDAVAKDNVDKTTERGHLKRSFSVQNHADTAIGKGAMLVNTVHSLTAEGVPVTDTYELKVGSKRDAPWPFQRQDVTGVNIVHRVYYSSPSDGKDDSTYFGVGQYPDGECYTIVDHAGDPIRTASLAYVTAPHIRPTQVNAPLTDEVLRDTENSFGNTLHDMNMRVSQFG